MRCKAHPRSRTLAASAVLLGVRRYAWRELTPRMISGNLKAFASASTMPIISARPDFAGAPLVESPSEVAAFWSFRLVASPRVAVHGGTFLPCHQPPENTALLAR